MMQPPQAITPAGELFLSTHQELIQHLSNETTDEKLRLSSLQHFRRLLSAEQEPPYQEIIDSGLLPTFITFLKSSIIKEQFEGAWIITNLLSGTSDQTAAVLQYEVIDMLLELTESDSIELVEQSLWGLGNIAGDCKEFRDEVVLKGVLPRITKVIDNNYQSYHTGQVLALIRTIAWALTSIFRPVNLSSLEEVELLLPYFMRLLVFNDNAVVNDTCWAIVYLCETSPHHVRLVAEHSKIIAELGNYLKDVYPRHKPILRVFAAVFSQVPYEERHEEKFSLMFQAIKHCCHNDIYQSLVQVMLFPAMLTALYHRSNTSLYYKKQLQLCMLSVYKFSDTAAAEEDEQHPQVSITPNYLISLEYFQSSKIREDYWKFFLLSTIAELNQLASDFPTTTCLQILLNNRIL